MLRKSSENKQHRHKADLLRLAKLQSISHELVIGTWEPASHGEHQTVLFLALHKKKKKKVRVILMPNGIWVLFQKHQQPLMDSLCPELLAPSCTHGYLFWQGFGRFPCSVPHRWFVRWAWPNIGHEILICSELSPLPWVAEQDLSSFNQTSV